MLGDTDDERIHGLVRIGGVGITGGGEVALDAYFAPGFASHGPSGDFTYDELKAYFAAMRQAFLGFSVTRSAVVRQGDLVGARTTMAGTFDRVLERSPVGPLQPTGKPLSLELVNMLRYDADRRLAEEWAGHDVLGMLRQLGVEMAPVEAKPEG